VSSAQAAYICFVHPHLQLGISEGIAGLRPTPWELTQNWGWKTPKKPKYGGSFPKKIGPGNAWDGI